MIATKTGVEGRCTGTVVSLIAIRLALIAGGLVALPTLWEWAWR